MRVAVFSDVHGNLIALDAVLRAAAADDVEEFWIIGDHVAHGPQPAETLTRIRSLPNVSAVRGNTDRYVLDGSHSDLVPRASASMSLQQVQLLVDSTASHAWTRGAIAATGHAAWLAGLPLETRTVLPDNTPVLLVHASPGRDDGPGITTDQTEQELLEERGLQDCGARLVFTGHTHWPCERRPPGVRVVNVGSVSLPHGQDRGATWTLLSADTAGYSLEHRIEPYDVSAVHDAIDAVRYPGADWLKSKFIAGQ
ncbi:putative phosphodiesterase [Friedmanniella endophytica]|uniref:Putative phosphodiesterase n=1 Tax=Microlunatus kandeliicorticis TaxID=1759536 RepID=A0A7W3IRR6_9ACTN|nr:metallophosphoesterase family protein [Microlunatus kandeliicorticis]MBA8793968.1 putative phosphodiesterase [Microlunatus kandeliicorticis]